MPFSLHNWMSAIPDADTCITQLAIPGTHDSGAFENCRVPMTQAHAAERTLRNQMDIGVRCLDLRCGDYSGTVYIYHGSIGFNTTITQAMEQISDFLDENGTEFIVLMLKQETGSVDISPRINTIISDGLGDKLHRFTSGALSWPTLRELQGKVLVLNRLKSERGEPHCDVGAWSGKPDRMEVNIPSSRLSMILQDNWEALIPLKRWSFVENKQTAIKALLDEANDISKRSNITDLYVNFLSYAWLGTDSPSNFGSQTNQWLIDSCAEGKGVVCVDAVDEAVTTHIISMNGI